MDNNMENQLEIIVQHLKELDNIYRKDISHTEISYNEFWIWYTLIILGESYSQQDICNLWSLSKQTVNTIVSNMVQKNFVTLEVIPGTKNRKQICLTETGRRYGEKIIMPIYEAEQRAISRLDEDELVICYALLEKFILTLEEEIHS